VLLSFLRRRGCEREVVGQGEEMSIDPKIVIKSSCKNSSILEMER